MRSTWGWLGSVAALAACNGDPAQPPQLLDTGWFTATSHSGDPENCEDRFVTWAPEDGATGWYWRDRPLFYTQTPDKTKYDVWLQDEAGKRFTTQLDWDDDEGEDGAGLSFQVEWDGYLEADTTYTLGFTDCYNLRTSTFHTSGFGQPLDVSPSDLIGNTYLLDLVGATWTEPPLLGGLIQTFFNQPILLGVRYADDVQIDLLAAPGKSDALGNVRQDLSLDSWDFPLADFTSAPYLNAPADHIVLTYQDVEIPVTSFLLEGTLSADGTRFGGGVLSGLADSRNAGGLLKQQGDEDALCDLAGQAGIHCEPCPDGEVYCLHLRAENLDGELLSGLVLVQNN